VNRHAFAQKIVGAILADLNGRSGLGLDGVDDDTQAEIRNALEQLVVKHIAPFDTWNSDMREVLQDILVWSADKRVRGSYRISRAESDAAESMWRRARNLLKEPTCDTE
jgi:hypothetical protein